jgi:hypothetical protein
MQFTNFCKKGYTIEVSFCTGVLKTFHCRTDTPLVCTKHPTKSSGLAICPLAMGGGGAGPIPASRPRSRPGEWLGSRACSPRGGLEVLAKAEELPTWGSTAAGGGCRDGSGLWREEAHGRQCATWGGSTGPRGESGTVGRRRERAALQVHRRRRQWRAAARVVRRGGKWRRLNRLAGLEVMAV